MSDVPFCETPDKCKDYGLLFSAREIGDKLCHVCRHKRLAAAEARCKHYELLWDIAVEYEGTDWAYDVMEEATQRSDK